MVVTDGEGRRVEGLSRDDFQLLVEGREVPIDAFREVRQTDPETAEPVSYLIFLDNVFSGRHYRDALLATLAEDLDRLATGDRMAVVRYGGRRLEWLCDWTCSIPALRRALDAAAENPTDELRQRARAAIPDPDLAFRIAENNIRRITTAAAASLAAFEDTAGRRVMVLASPGWTYEMDSFGYLPGRRSAPSRVYGGPELLAPLIDAANLLGVTIYPIHLEPLPTDPRFDASHRTLTRSFLGASQVLSIRLESLDRIAEATGGRVQPHAVGGRRRLDRIREDLGSYYVLGLSPEPEGDDEKHEIEVRVLQPGLEVRHRTDYLDLAPATRADRSTESALLLGAREGKLEVEVGEPRPTAKRKVVEVPFRVQVPRDRLLTDAGGRLRADLELRVEAHATAGDRSELQTTGVALASGEVPHVYDASVLLRRQPQRVVFSLFDRRSGALWYRVVELDP